MPEATDTKAVSTSVVLRTRAPYRAGRWNRSEAYNFAAGHEEHCTPEDAALFLKDARGLFEVLSGGELLDKELVEKNDRAGAEFQARLDVPPTEPDSEPEAEPASLSDGDAESPATPKAAEKPDAEPPAEEPPPEPTEPRRETRRRRRESADS